MFEHFHFSPKIWPLILLHDWDSLPCMLALRIWCFIKTIPIYLLLMIFIILIACLLEGNSNESDPIDASVDSSPTHDWQTTNGYADRRPTVGGSDLLPSPCLKTKLQYIAKRNKISISTLEGLKLWHCTNSIKLKYCKYSTILFFPLPWYLFVLWWFRLLYLEKYFESVILNADWQ